MDWQTDIGKEDHCSCRYFCDDLCSDYVDRQCGITVYWIYNQVRIRVSQCQRQSGM
mgnify:CR=1 FL=1